MSTEVRYFRCPGGSLTAYTGENVPVSPPPGCTEITESEYATELEALEAQNAQHVADLKAVQQANAKADYDALIAASIPETTARRLSGYIPPTTGDE